ncbi:sigma-70 family RNA polymerase sigma factor, partial [Mycobacterium gordonae]|nr:sigma-70 family RNA polymerase sigma factor [Mycobacterium gordonae]
HKNRGKLDARSSVKSWLLKVTINICRDMMRTPWWKRVLLNAEHAEPARGSVEQDVLLAETGNELYNSVLALDEPYRSVVLLYYYHDLSTPEIGQVLQISQGTVRSRLHRARLLLREDWIDKSSGTMSRP